MTRQTLSLMIAGSIASALAQRRRPRPQPADKRFAMALPLRVKTTARPPNIAAPPSHDQLRRPVMEVSAKGTCTA